jgi:biotin transport system substrate-specific component
VPITAQTLGVMLAGGILGSKRGALAMLLLLLLVAIGLPLLSGGRGGPTVFVGPSAGFLIGWVAAAFVVGWLTERFWSRVNVALACSFNLLGGIVVLYAFGVGSLDCSDRKTCVPTSETSRLAGLIDAF